MKIFDIIFHPIFREAIIQHKGITKTIKEETKIYHRGVNTFSWLGAASFVIRTLIKAFDYIESDENNFNFKKELTALLLKSGFAEYEIKKVFRFLNFVFEINDQRMRREFYEKVNKMSVKAQTKIELTDYEEIAFEIASEKKAKEKTEKIAKKMKDNGEPIDKIIEYTELTREEIEKL